MSKVEQRENVSIGDLLNVYFKLFFGATIVILIIYCVTLGLLGKLPEEPNIIEISIICAGIYTGLFIVIALIVLIIDHQGTKENYNSAKNYESNNIIAKNQTSKKKELLGTASLNKIPEDHKYHKAEFSPFSAGYKENQQYENNKIGYQANQQNNTIHCPQCGSSNYSANKQGFGLGKAVAGGLITGPIGVGAGFIGSRKVQITCLQCGHTWFPGGK
jgi:ribosomal protein L37E